MLFSEWPTVHSEPARRGLAGHRSMVPSHQFKQCLARVQVPDQVLFLRPAQFLFGDLERLVGEQFLVQRNIAYRFIAGDYFEAFSGLIDGSQLQLEKLGIDREEVVTDFWSWIGSEQSLQVTLGDSSREVSQLDRLRCVLVGPGCLEICELLSGVGEEAVRAAGFNCGRAP